MESARKHPRFSELRELIESGLSRLLTELEAPHPLGSAIRYVMESGGKRVRPLLALALFEDLGGEVERLLPAALAIELLHNASLIHDDLPALDNDDMRRGKNTCHVQFDEATAILAGDFIVPFALELVNAAKFGAEINNQIILALMRAFQDLLRGQQLDINGPRTIGEIFETSRLKTGALFAATAVIPALAAEVDRVTATNIRTLGESIGICFQIENDFLDKSGDPDRRGRAQRSDERNQKVNHASLDISESIIPEINRLQRQITSQLRSIEHNLAKRGVKLACSRAVLREIFSDAEIVKLEF